MKKNGNGINKLISTIILCSFGYYVINNLNLNNELINKVETSVNVTDEGISYGVDNIYDAFVSVNVVKEDQVLGAGSGFVISKDGYILTNHHVVNGGNSFKLSFMNGKTITAFLIGSDEYADIAVLKIDENEVGKIARIGNSDSVKLGDTVFTV